MRVLISCLNGLQTQQEGPIYEKLIHDSILTTQVGISIANKYNQPDYAAASLQSDSAVFRRVLETRRFRKDQVAALASEPGGGLDKSCPQERKPLLRLVSGSKKEDTRTYIGIGYNF